MTHRQTFVVVGAGLTGGAAVATLRGEGFDGRIVLIGEEPHPPYERPPLSKEYLRGESSLEDALLQPLEWYRETDVDLLLGVRVTRVDTAERKIDLEDGGRVPYDRLLVATGGRNRRLDVPGRDLEGIFDLRTVEDADRIRAAATAGRKVVVVGAGFIGCEVAASLRLLGVDVEAVEIFETTLWRILGSDVGGVIERIHLDHGVRFHFGEVVQRFDGDAGRVERVLTDAGTSIECDAVVVGVGIEPATEIVQGSAVRVEDGIVVDERCRTGAPDVFAAGDVANHRHPIFGRHLRVEHYDNALKQGAAAARSMLGDETPFDDPHWFWSDQYDANIQHAGFAPGSDRFVVRGSLQERRFVGFHLSAGVVRAIVAVDRGRDLRRAMPLIRAAVPVDEASLGDEDVDLKRLASEALRAGAARSGGEG